MKKPIYIRDGSRFRRIEYYTGMFWNLDGHFTETEKDDSIGIVVSQDGNELTIASLKPSTSEMTWNEAKNYCSSFSSDLSMVRLCYLPTRSELLSTVDKFREYLYHYDNSEEWTSNEHDKFACHLYWYSYEGVKRCLKSCPSHVRIFYKVEI